MIVQMESVGVRFGALRALDAVSFVVPEGSLTGLIGRNGAGKSTSIRMLAGLLEPTEAGSRVTVHGFSPSEGRREIAASTGFLLSDPALFPYLTAAETLRFVGRAYSLTNEMVERRIIDLVAFFDLEAAADRLVDAYSTGMRKRLALAAALIHAPTLLVLDEPFESLDPLMVRALKKLLIDYVAGGGTVLLSSHLIDAVEEICDRVVILEAGRVVGAGRTEEVKRGIRERLPSGTLEDLYASLVPASRSIDLAWLLER
jgi:ABC-2 type transport system ATP-binding protein